MDFDQLIDRRGTGSVKWDQYGEALPLWVADMDFAAPPPVIRALHERVAHGVFGYTGPPADLRELIQAWLLAHHGWRVEAGWITFLPGVMRGVNMLARAVGRPGDGILLQPPVYYPFFDVVPNSGRLLQQAEISRGEGRYEIDMEAFEAAITDRTRLFLLCNPHNPVGRVFTRPELEQLAEICLRHDLIISSDEIHSDLIFSGHQHLPMAALSPEIARRTVTTLAPSKTFNLPGLSCAVMIISDPELRERVEAAGAGLVHGSNLMGYVAAQAAYAEGEEWLTELLKYLEANRDFVDDFVKTRLPGVQSFRPEGSYLAWLDCRSAPIPGNPQKFFLERAGVAVNDGAKFGRGGEGFVRLNFGCPRATLVEALTRMERVLLETASEPVPADSREAALG